jgi:hypothetical protein
VGHATCSVARATETGTDPAGAAAASTEPAAAGAGASQRARRQRVAERVRRLQVAARCAGAHALDRPATCRRRWSPRRRRPSRCRRRQILPFRGSAGVGAASRRVAAAAYLRAHRAEKLEVAARHPSSEVAAAVAHPAPCGWAVAAADPTLEGVVRRKVDSGGGAAVARPSPSWAAAVGWSPDRAAGQPSQAVSSSEPPTRSKAAEAVVPRARATTSSPLGHRTRRGLNPCHS